MGIIASRYAGILERRVQIVMWQQLWWSQLNQLEV